MSDRRSIPVVSKSEKLVYKSLVRLHTGAWAANSSPVRAEAETEAELHLLGFGVYCDNGECVIFLDWIWKGFGFGFAESTQLIPMVKSNPKVQGFRDSAPKLSK